MSYTIDRRLVRAVGNLLAAGSGTFTAPDVRRMFQAAQADNRLLPAESTAMLVLCVAVGERCDEEAAALLLELVHAARQDDPALERWLGKAVSLPVLQKATGLIAGRGPGHRVSRDDIVGLIRDAYEGGGPKPEISADEALALLVARELLDGRMKPDAQKLFDEMCVAARHDGVTLGGADPGGGTRPPGVGSSGRQCGRCSGSGSVTCSACVGYGYHQRSGRRTGYDGSPEYYEERVPCGCRGGSTSCGACGGSGRL